MKVTLPLVLKEQINGAIKNMSYRSDVDEMFLTFYDDWNAGYLATLLNDELMSFMRMRQNRQINVYEVLSLRPVAKLIGNKNVGKIIRQMNEVVINSINDLMGFTADFSLPTRFYSKNLCKKFDEIMDDFGVSEHYDKLYRLSWEWVKELQRKSRVGVI